MSKILPTFLILLFTFDSFADKKSFQGLFGSYRRERYVENEGSSNDIGFDIMLSTLIPTTSIVKSNEGSEWKDLYYASFFNFEGQVFFTINYSWHIYASIGRYFYETRRENAVTDNNNPLFHQFEMESIPLIGGIKYRFTTDDIVPYVGIGSGMARVRRKAFYDSSTSIYDEDIKNVIIGELVGGFEFFISSNVGIKLEMAAYYMALKERIFSSTSITEQKKQLPDFLYQPNLFSVRYASGIFVLF